MQRVCSCSKLMIRWFSGSWKGTLFWKQFFLGVWEVHDLSGHGRLRRSLRSLPPFSFIFVGLGGRGLGKLAWLLLRCFTTPSRRSGSLAFGSWGQSHFLDSGRVPSRGVPLQSGVLHAAFCGL